VLDGPQGKFVYVVGKDKDGNDVATPRPVVVGDWVGADGANKWVIESGLKPGDRVIVDGVAKLMPGAKIKVGPDAAANAASSGAAPAATAAKQSPPSSSASEPAKESASATGAKPKS